MGGQIRGRLECLFPPSYNSEPKRDSLQAMFTALYKYHKYLETLGIVTEIARHGGVSSTAANVNFWDETNPFKNNAWFVFRWNTHSERSWPYYVYYQFNRSDVGNFTAAPASPSAILGTSATAYTWFSLGMQAAIGVGGDQNPWNGAGTMGQNTKGTPVWKIPSGGSAVHVFPRSNNIGGSHNTNKENCAGLYLSDYSSVQAHRMHMWSDLDGLFWTFTSSDTGYYWFHYTGVYTPRAEVPTPTYPLVQFTMNAAWSSTQYGDYAGTSNYQGGVYSQVHNAVRPMRFCGFDEWAYVEPDSHAVGKKFLRPWRMMVDAEKGDSEAGYLGNVAWFKCTSLTVTEGHRPDPDHIWFYHYDMQSSKLLMPWKRGLAYRHNATRDGVDFVFLATPLTETVSITEGLVVTP
jgi:hypothetical protein